jgi:ABC-type polysaccharide/polyol phosphate export permease
MEVETSENEPMQNDFQDYLFVFCVIFLIIIAILFAGVVSYLYILFKDYLDSLA